MQLVALCWRLQRHQPSRWRKTLFLCASPRTSRKVCPQVETNGRLGPAFKLVDERVVWAGYRLEAKAQGVDLLVLWYRNQIYAIEGR